MIYLIFQFIGIQTTVLTCVREHTQTPVPNKRCYNLDKPPQQQIRCNIIACPAHWGGTWGPCSGSCGQGTQNFIPQCIQDTPTGVSVVVSSNLCQQSKPISTNRPCPLPTCRDVVDNEVYQSTNSKSTAATSGEIYDWKVGSWSPVSLLCTQAEQQKLFLQIYAETLISKLLSCTSYSFFGVLDFHTY